MKKKDPFIVYGFYGTIGMLIVAICLIIGIYGGVQTLFYFVLFPLLIVYLAFTFLPGLLAIIVFAGLTVLGAHYFIGAWSFTILFICYWVLMIAVSTIVKDENWLKVATSIISVTFVFAIFIVANLSTLDAWFNKPEITEEQMERAVEIIEDRDDVLNAAIGIEEKELIYYSIHVEGSLTRDEKIDVAETSASVLDVIVNEKENKEDFGGEVGNLYTYYELEMMIGTDERGVVLIGRKEIDAEEVQWRGTGL